MESKIRRTIGRCNYAGAYGGLAGRTGFGYTCGLTLPSRQLGNTENVMVKIRLTRGGAKKRPFYHIIVTDSRNARDGRNIERLGYFNPVATGQEKRVELDLERAKHWIGTGAQMTDKVADLHKQAVKAAAAQAPA